MLNKITLTLKHADVALSRKEIQINVHVVNVCAAGENWVMGEGHWVKRNNEDELQKKTEWIYVQEEKEMGEKQIYLCKVVQGRKRYSMKTKQKDEEERKRWSGGGCGNGQCSRKDIK